MRKRRLVSFGALLFCCLATAACDVQELPSSKPDLLLITLDTVRADHLSLQGYHRNTSPNIAELAASGVTFDHAVAQASWTLPSMGSVFTSLYPSEHGANRAGHRISSRVATIAEFLQEKGYHTIGVSSHSMVNARHGFGRGFAEFDETQISDRRSVTSEDLTAIALKRLALAPRKPTFLWVHYFDPHYEYIRHREYQFAGGRHGLFPNRIKKSYLNRIRRRDGQKADDYRSPELDYIEAVYDEELAYTDHWIGELVKGVNALDRGPTAIALTADHGEFFLDRPPQRRFYHSRDLHEALIHVPLVFAGDIADAYRGRRYPHTVETRSVPKTLMHLAGITDHPFEGEDLIALMESKSDPKRRIQYSESSDSSGKRPHRSVISYPWKIIFGYYGNRYELFNLERDPDETHNLWKETDPALEPVRVKMKAELDERALDRTELPPPEKFELNKEETDRLRALGYAL